MAVLKKIKASTLMETLVATVLIVVLFMTASMVLNNLFSASIQNNTYSVKQELFRLQYAYQNGVLELPYLAEIDDSQLTVKETKLQGVKGPVFLAKHMSTNQEIALRP